MAGLGPQMEPGAPALPPAPALPSAQPNGAPWVGLAAGDADRAGMWADEEAAPAAGRDAPAGILSGLPWLSTTDEMLRGIGAEAVQGGFGSLGRAAAPTLLGLGAGGAAAVGEDTTPVEPEQANAEGKPFGLKFEHPVPRMVLNSMVGAAEEEQKRQQIAAQVPAGLPSILHAGASFAAQLLDPVNVAAAFVPIGGDEFVAAGLAKAGVDLGEGLAARTAERAAAGAVTGAAGMVPVTGALAMFDQAEGRDMAAADALHQVLGGAVFGGVLHPLAGAAGDAWRAAFGKLPVGRIAEADPEIRRQATDAAIAATVEDRPVQVHDLIELSAREREQALALRSLHYDQKQPIAWRLNALEDDLTAPGTPEAVQGNLAEQHAALSDIVASRADLAGIGVDEATQARLQAIEEELTQPGPLTAQRQGALLAEHRMLTEGAQPPSELEQARDEAQRRGNQIAISRNEARIAELQDQIRSSATVRQALGAGAPEDVAGSRQAQIAADAHTPPKPVAEPPADLPEIETMVHGLLLRSHTPAESDAAMEQIDAHGAEYEGFAKAMEALGSCMGGAA